MAENIRPFVTEEQKSEHSSFNKLAELLRLLDDNDIKCTLFVVGKLLKNKDYVNLLSDAVMNGHEIGSHTYGHKLLYDLDFDETYEEIFTNDQIIESTLGVKPVGFRSPCFSTNKHLDAVLNELNYKYTSNSIIASMHDRYNQKVCSEQNRMLDIPLPTFNFLHLNFPATGGGWFRLFPFWLQKFTTRKMNNTMFYCHPWDFDAEQPRVDNVSRFTWYRHTVNNAHSFSKFRKFLCEEYDFVRGIDLVDTNQ